MCQQGIWVVQGAGGAPRRSCPGWHGWPLAGVPRHGAGAGGQPRPPVREDPQAVWRVSRATDAPLLGTAPLRWGRSAQPRSPLAAPVGGARVPMGLASLAPPRGASVMPATHGCPACAHGVVATAEEEGRCERPPVPGSSPAAARRATLLHTRAQAVRCPLAHRAGQALHRVASSSKVGSGMPACQVGSRNSSRLPLGSKKYSSRPGKTPSFR